MKTKTQIKAEIEALQKELERVEGAVRWRAEKNGSYYYLDSSGGVARGWESGNSADNYRYATGNYFKTKKEAEQHETRTLARQRCWDWIRKSNAESAKDDVWVVFADLCNVLFPTDSIEAIGSNEHEWILSSFEDCETFIAEMRDDIMLAKGWSNE